MLSTRIQRNMQTHACVQFIKCSIMCTLHLTSHISRHDVGLVCWYDRFATLKTSRANIAAPQPAHAPSTKPTLHTTAYCVCTRPRQCIYFDPKQNSHLLHTTPEMFSARMPKWPPVLLVGTMNGRMRIALARVCFVR